MRTSFISRLLLVMAVAAALFIMASHASSRVSSVSVCESEEKSLEATDTRLWESLSHQFLSSVQY